MINLSAKDLTVRVLANALITKCFITNAKQGGYNMTWTMGFPTHSIFLKEDKQTQ